MHVFLDSDRVSTSKSTGFSRAGNFRLAHSLTFQYGTILLSYLLRADNARCMLYRDELSPIKECCFPFIFHYRPPCPRCSRRSVGRSLKNFSCSGAPKCIHVSRNVYGFVTEFYFLVARSSTRAFAIRRDVWTCLNRRTSIV